MSRSRTEQTELSRSAITDQLRALGVAKGGVLLVHTSFRAARPVEGGPLGLIKALRDALGSDGTLVMPSWSGDDDQPFDAMTTPASPDLGVVADTFWRLASVLRSDHFFAFAAAGPNAARIISDRLPLPPHIPESPVGRVHDLDGQVLLLGVGHDADTTLHLAELMAAVPYRVPKSCTVLRDGRPVRIEYGEDHCCERFAFADEWLRGRRFQSEGLVGHAHARLARALLGISSRLRLSIWREIRSCSSIPRARGVSNATRRDEARRRLCPRYDPCGARLPCEQRECPALVSLIIGSSRRESP